MSDTILGIIIGGSFTLGGSLISLLGSWIKEHYSITVKNAEQKFVIQKEIFNRKINVIENAAMVYVELHSFCIGLNKLFNVLVEQDFEFDENQYNHFSSNLLNSYSEISKISYKQSLALSIYLEKELDNLIVGEQELQEMLTSFSLIHQLNQKFDKQLSSHTELIDAGKYEQAKSVMEQNDITWEELKNEVLRIIKLLERVKTITFDFVIILRNELNFMKS